jgi:hypothetical protein
MESRILSRWPLQSLAGIALVLLVSSGFASLQPSAQAPPAQQPAAAASTDTCPEGFYGSPATGCTDVNECASANGGCHKLASCKNEPGSRTCGTCPKDFAGDGYVGCFDVNECPNGDCSDRIPTAAEVESTPPPVVTTSGDVTVAAVAETGAPATFTVTAKDAKDRLRPAYCLPRAGSTFPIGKTVVSCWASDTRGKIGRATLTVTVNRPEF